MNRDQPVKIEAVALEVRDKSQQATFIGNVKLTQGDTILQCQILVIFYEDATAMPGAAEDGAARGGPGGCASRSSAPRPRATCVVTQKDQTAKATLASST